MSSLLRIDRWKRLTSDDEEFVFVTARRVLGWFFKVDAYRMSFRQQKDGKTVLMMKVKIWKRKKGSVR